MQTTLFTRIDLNFYLKFTLKICVNLIACFEIISVKSRYKINNFSTVTSICPKYYCTQLCCTKNSCREIYLQ